MVGLHDLAVAQCEGPTTAVNFGGDIIVRHGMGDRKSHGFLPKVDRSHRDTSTLAYKGIPPISADYKAGKQGLAGAQ